MNTPLILPPHIEPKFLQEPEGGFKDELVGAKFPVISTPQTVSSQGGVIWIGIPLYRFNVSSAIACLLSQAIEITNYFNLKQNLEIQKAETQKGLRGMMNRLAGGK